MGQSEIGKLVDRKQFVDAMIRACKFDMNPDPNFIPDADQKKLINASINRFLSGNDVNGKRVATNSFWDIASRKFVQEATGSFRVIAPTIPHDLSIFVQSELPALLKNAKITDVDGIPHAQLLKLLESKDIEAVKRLILSNALTHAIYANL